MPNLNRTEIAAIMDRSGSMANIARDMEGGFITFVQEQLKEPGELFVSLYQFDTDFDVVFQEAPGAAIGKVNLVPRGGTALYDAIGKATVLIGERLAKKPEHERPGAVIVLVITDGHENASKEYTQARVRQIIKHQEEQYNWRYAYLGASEAGLKQDGVIFTQSSKAAFDATPQGVMDCYVDTSHAIRSYRNEVASNNLGASLDIAGSRNRSSK